MMYQLVGFLAFAALLLSAFVALVGALGTKKSQYDEDPGLHLPVSADAAARHSMNPLFVMILIMCSIGSVCSLSMITKQTPSVNIETKE